MDARKRLTISLLILLLVLLVGAAGFHVLGLNSLDSVYMAVLFLTTTGSRDVDVNRLGMVGEIWAVIVITIGAAAAAIAFSNLVALVAGGELQKIIGRRKVETKIHGLKHHHIICGYGRIGMPLCEELQARNVPFIVIDNDPVKIDQLDRRSYIYIHGDATEESILVHAGIERARGLVSVLASDADNVFVTLTARGLNPHLQIVALSEGKGTETKLLRAGANRVVSPHHIGASRITNLLLRPAVVELSDVAARGVDLEIEEITVGPDSPLAGKLLRDSQLREHFGAMVVAVKRLDGSSIFAPTAETPLQTGDTLITIRKCNGAKG